MTPPRVPVPNWCNSVSPECPVEGTIYGYTPDLAVNCFFAGFFGAVCLVNLFVGIKYKTWSYMVAVGLGCLGECLGYVGRIIMNNNPYDNDGFILQVVLLIFAPSFLAAGIYLSLKHVVMQFGAEWSRIKPAFYTYIFIGCDISSLILQSVGGALAATADPGDDIGDVGTDMMIAGIIWQVVVLVIFATLVIDYSIRTYRRRDQLSQSALDLWSQRRFKLFCTGVVIAFTTIFVRCIYRIPELIGGWGGPLMRDELEFILLEGAMIVIAVTAQTLFHPGFCFPAMANNGKATQRRSKDIEMEAMSIQATS